MVNAAESVTSGTLELTDNSNSCKKDDLLLYSAKFCVAYVTVTDATAYLFHENKFCKILPFGLFVKILPHNNFALYGMWKSGELLIHVDIYIDTSNLQSQLALL